MNKKLKLHLYFFAALYVVLDPITTYLGLVVGLEEGNPMVSYIISLPAGMFLLLLFKTLIVLMLVFLHDYEFKINKKETSLKYLVLLFLNTIMSIVIISNIYFILNSKPI